MMTLCKFRLHPEKDVDIISRLESEKDMSKFVKHCIRSQMFAEVFAKNFMIVDKEEMAAFDMQQLEEGDYK